MAKIKNPGYAEIVTANIISDTISAIENKWMKLSRIRDQFVDVLEQGQPVGRHLREHGTGCVVHDICKIVAATDDRAVCR
jgi:hypothetical protein